MRRRTVLTAAAALATPRIVRAESDRVLRFIPGSDLPSLDPVSGGGNTARDHCNMIYDQLFGLDADYRPHPQMLAGVRTDPDGKTWELTLRDGLLFHDDTPVLARDCVASLLRWARRDSYGSSLMQRTDEIAATSDRTIRIRLKRPFALLPEALAQPSCVILPERVAQTDAFKQITETIGSGPFRFLPDERVHGARWAYARFEKYVPRPEGTPSFLAGPRVVHFDRTVWTYIPDTATAAAAMTTGEHDWWENPTHDLIGTLRHNPALRVEVKERMGLIGMLRLNHLHKPFDNPAIRRLVLACVNQDTFMQAVAGAEPDLYRTKMGLFSPGTPMATAAGTEALIARTDFAAVQRALSEAGYNGEKVVLISSAAGTHFAMSQVAADLLRQMGFAVDYQTQDFAAITRRRINKEPPEKGGWNATVFNSTGLLNVFLPANYLIRGGSTASTGWPDVPRIEALREDWLNAQTSEEQKRLASEIQRQFFHDVPHAPLGLFYAPTCFRGDLADIQPGSPVMHAVRRV